MLRELLTLRIPTPESCSDVTVNTSGRERTEAELLPRLGLPYPDDHS